MSDGHSDYKFPSKAGSKAGGVMGSPPLTIIVVVALEEEVVTRAMVLRFIVFGCLKAAARPDSWI